jgi:hypothetical protein
MTPMKMESAKLSQQMFSALGSRQHQKLREVIRARLDVSEAFRALPLARQERIAQDTEQLVTFLTDAPTGAGTLAAQRSALLDPIDYPAFVSKLIEGVFEAVVNSSIEQMKAYAELLANAGKQIPPFAREIIDIEPSDGDSEEAAAASARFRIARERQQTLATMVMQGLSRIPKDNPDDDD